VGCDPAAQTTLVLKDGAVVAETTLAETG